MNFGLDSIDRANARARNAARLFAAALFVASLMLAFSARAASTQPYDVDLRTGGTSTDRTLSEGTAVSTGNIVIHTRNK